MRRVVLVGLASLVVTVPANAATPRVVSLPWPPSILPKEPPLSPPSSGLVPLNPRFLGRLSNRERVVVGLDVEGKPQSVRVGQKIVIRALGDYVFTIPAPVLSVTPAPGTRSQPGQRENQIIWEGFSPGNRLLASEAELRPANSVAALPVRIRVETTVGGRPLSEGEVRSGPLRVLLTITNATAVAVRSYTADVDQGDLDLVLGRIRGAIRRNVFAEGLNVGLRSPRTRVTTSVAAPLRVEGVLRFEPGTVRLEGHPSGVVHFAERLDDRHRQLRLELRGQATNARPPRVDARVQTDTIPDTVRAGQPSRVRLARTIGLELTYARKRQYDQFLASPEASGPSSTTYVFRTAAHIADAVSSPAAGGNDRTVLWIVLGVALVAAVPAATVAWAHS
jgi:hypothetical protein